MLHESTIPSFSTHSSKREWTRLIRAFVWMELRELAQRMYSYEVLGMMWQEGRHDVLVPLAKVYTSATLYLLKHAWAHSKQEIHLIIVAGMCAALHVKEADVAHDLEEALELEDLVQEIKSTEEAHQVNPWHLVPS